MNKDLKKTSFHCCVDCKKDKSKFPNEKYCFRDCLKKKTNLEGPKLKCYLDNYYEGENEEYGIKVCMLPYMKCKNFIGYNDKGEIKCGPLTKEGTGANCNKIPEFE